MLLLNWFAAYAAFTPVHDATHRTVPRSPWLNDLLGTIACFGLLPGFTTRIYRYLHLKHLGRPAGSPRRAPLGRSSRGKRQDVRLRISSPDAPSRAGCLASKLALRFPVKRQ
jgi:hypothetical protein